MKRLFRTLIRLILIIAGFLFILNLPSLLGIGRDRITINFLTFWEVVKSNFNGLLDFKDANYLDYFKKLPIAESYQYTMTILIVSLITIIIISLILAVLIMLTPKKIRTCLKNGMNLFESVPDLLVIFLFQFFVITLYKTTGLKFLQLYGIFGEKPYFVPIMTVSFLPLFLLTQFLIKVMTEEQNQPYVLYAKAKGIGRIKTLLIHILRNIFPLLVLQLRTIVWVLLSNIYLIEFLFNIDGFNQQFIKILFTGRDFASLIACLLMLSLPLLMIEAAGWMISRMIKGKESVAI